MKRTIKLVVMAMLLMVGGRIFAQGSNGILVYQSSPEYYCDGIYDYYEPSYKNGHAFHTPSLNINRDHFRIVFSYKLFDDYKVMFRGTPNETVSKVGTVIALSRCRRLVVYVHENGYIYVTTNNHNNTYLTNLRFSTNRYLSFDLEYDHGVLIFNGQRMYVEMDTSDDGCDSGFHSLDYGCGDAFHGYIKDIEIYTYPN